MNDILNKKLSRAQLLAYITLLEFRLGNIGRLHKPKHGERIVRATACSPIEAPVVEFEPYVICDYDKTTWPCKTAELLKEFPREH